MSEEMLIEVIRSEKRSNVGIYQIYRETAVDLMRGPFHEELIGYVSGDEKEIKRYYGQLKEKDDMLGIRSVNVVDIKELIRKYKG